MDVVDWAAAERLYWEEASAALDRARDIVDCSLRRQARQGWAEKHGFKALAPGSSAAQYKQWRKEQDKWLLRKLTAARSTSAAAQTIAAAAGASGATDSVAAGSAREGSAASSSKENSDPERDVELEQLEVENERLLECALRSRTHTQNP